MEIIAIILSGLALLAASVCLAVVIWVEKRSAKQRAAMADFVADECTKVLSVLDKVMARVEALEKGVIPDYEKAAEAVKSVNDFNAGLSAIMGFDPFEALRREQKNEQLGGEVE